MKFTFPRNTTLLLIACTLIACSGETLDGGSTRYACDNRSIESTCATFPEHTVKEDAAKYCDGSVIAQGCPPENVIGDCSIGVPTVLNTYYSDGPTPWTEATAREACADFNGMFQRREPSGHVQ